MTSNMIDISAKMVAELRTATGSGFMDCKRALQEANGDMKRAEELLRIKSGAKVSKVAGRTAAEGIIAAFIAKDAKHGALVEVNCETDFVARDNSFVEFAHLVAEAAVVNNIVALDKLNSVVVDGVSIEERRIELIGRIGENISIRRLQYVTTDGTIVPYVHGARIGVLVSFKGSNLEVAKDVAMHIAAMKPLGISSDDLDAAVVESEKRICIEQIAALNKPQAIADKMLEGKLQKYMSEVTLLNQTFVKNQDVTIGQLLNQHNASITQFVLFVVGEGIVRQETNLADEVSNLCTGK